MTTTSPEMDKATCNKKELVLELTKGVSNVQCPHRDRETRGWSRGKRAGGVGGGEKKRWKRNSAYHIETQAWMIH